MVVLIQLWFLDYSELLQSVRVFSWVRVKARPACSVTSGGEEDKDRVAGSCPPGLASVFVKAGADL